MPHPNSPAPPRLTSAPIPLPPAFATGAYAGAGLVYDLDRVDELPFVHARLFAPFQAEEAELPTDPAERRPLQRALDRRYYAAVAAYCCEGLYSADGTRLAGALDDAGAWEACPSFVVLRWVTQGGLKGARGEIDDPFRLAASAMGPASPTTSGSPPP